MTGLYEENAAETISYVHRLQTDGPAGLAMGSSVNAGNRRAIVMAYMGPSLIGNSNPLRLEPIRVPQLTAGPSVPMRYFVRAGSATDPGAFVDLPTSLVEINNGGNAQRDVLKSQATVLQSYWLRDHLVTMFGWRRDESYFVNQAITFVPNPNDPNDAGKVHYGFDDFSFPRTPPLMAAGETKSYSAVLKWPQRLWRLPAGSDLSVFYNFSGNFSPAGGRVNTYGEPLPAPRGETEEVGFNLSTLRDRVSLRLNWYETNVLGRSANPGGYTSTRANLIFATAGRFWPAEGNLNPQNVPFMQAALAKLFSALPPNYAALHKFTVTDPVSGAVVPFREIPLSGYPLGSGPAALRPGTVQTYGDYLDAQVFVPYATALATEGSVSAEQRKWRFNLVTNYSFRRGSPFGEKLKGLSIGAGVRWQDRLGIGYPATRNPNGSVNLDLKHPYYAPAETNVDFFTSYERRIFGERIGWRIQLNVRNALSADRLIPVTVQPWGEAATVRLPPERRWFVTNAFSF